ncbi:MAG: MCE family protein [Aeromicrobium sp.]|uniref:MCE family protein n=1 Tax=Aeromicrobium sp. TaxID=1871063 RepID=UPI0026138E8D|nr:MCE family protein [Aeromicrobium sp.]MDF1704252.1 MCE family protein [Aeromicrobium sp.]
MAARNRNAAARRGLVAVAVVVLLAVMVFNLHRMPFVGAGGRTVSAEFSEVGSLYVGDPVQIAGVDVGTVKSIDLGRGHVLVRFTIEDHVELGTSTSAAIRVSNLLGSSFLEVLPAGSGQLDTSEAIPVSRTEPPFDVVAAFGGLTETIEGIDTAQLQAALASVADTFRESPADVQAAVQGLSEVSSTIADRDAEVASLLQESSTLSSTLAASSADVAGLIEAAAGLVAVLDDRRAAISSLLTSTQALAAELQTLVTDNQTQLAPALTDLEATVTLLQQRQTDLTAIAANLSTFARVFSDAIGTGPWFDSFIPNVPTQIQIGEVAVP